MIEEQARVVSLQGDFAEVTVRQPSACGSCSAKGGCGTSLLAAWFPRRHLSFRMRNDIGARPGDTVTVGLDERYLQRGSLLLYALPLAGLLFAAILGERLFLSAGLSPELGAVLSGLLGLGGALITVRRLTTRSTAGAASGVRLLRVTGRQPGSAIGGIVPPPSNFPLVTRNDE